MIDERPIGAALNRDLTPSEKKSVASIDALIERQHAKRVREEGERRTEELWKESERRVREKRHAQARLEWHSHHLGQASRLRATLEELIEHHEQQAEKYLPEGAA